MEFVDRFQELVRNVTVAFQKPKQERSKCPRCKGSGLLVQQRPWGWQQKTVSNDPCWFCEGIGVMPVAGLNGFMLGRASSAFHTRDITSRAGLPIKVQLYLGKFPETQCKLGTYKASENPKGLFHDFWGVPDWLRGENFQPPEHTVAQELPPAPAPLFAREKTSISPRLSPATVKSRGSSSSFRNRAGKHDVPVPRLSRQPGTPGTNSLPPRSSPGFVAGISPKETRDPAPKLARSVSKATMVSPPGQIYGGERAEGESFGPKSVHLGAPLLRSPKCSKMSRRGRNRIREKAEKEAAERARRIQGGPSIPEVEVSAQRTASIKQEELEPANWINKLPSLSWLEPSKRPSSSDYSWVNQIVYGSIKERTPHSAIPGKAFVF